MPSDKTLDMYVLEIISSASHPLSRQDIFPAAAIYAAALGYGARVSGGAQIDIAIDSALFALLANGKIKRQSDDRFNAV